jgi:hypothetical protein
VTPHARLIAYLVLGALALVACGCVWLDTWLNGDHGDEGEED